MGALYSITGVLLLLFSFFARRKDEARLYLVGSFFLVAFCLLKPFESGKDDLTHVDIVLRGCVGDVCSSIFTEYRDILWRILISKGDPLIVFNQIKLVGAIALMGKLWVIYKLSINKLFSLCTYFFLFYYLHDLTQYRAGFSSALFLLAFYLLASSRSILCLVASF